MTSSLPEREANEFCEIAKIPGVFVDLRYATTNNFTGEVLYDKSAKPLLHRHAAQKLKIAVQIVKAAHPDWNLLVLDALRPRSVQRRLWDFVKDTPKEIYVANPDRGSIHNFGLAVDLTLADENGRELDMGTPFDSFEELAQPRHEDKFFSEGLLNAQQLANRRLLRAAMTEAGFITIPHEWWHFNSCDFAEATSKYQIVE
jgi:zinc D-Ala-D-Ala dipeptidase